MNLYMLCDSLSCCIAVQITLLPAVLYYSYETTFISIILNCIVIPLMPVVMISGIITGIAGLISINAAVFFAGAADYILMDWCVILQGRMESLMLQEDRRWYR